MQLHKTTSGETVEFENERVRVLRVRIDAHEKHPPRTRNDCVLVWLTDTEQRRTEGGGQAETIRRKAGEAAWRPASTHQIENTGDSPVEVVIVELK